MGLGCGVAAGHHGVRLDGNSLDRLVVWMDTYGQRLGSFSSEQEVPMCDLRRRWRDLLIERLESVQKISAQRVARKRVE